MSDLKELYQEVILDHNHSPRNFRKLENANRHSVGYNPLCGDKMDLYLNMEGDHIKDIGFLGSGCAISKASASLMTTVVKGKTKSEVDRLFEKFHRMVTGHEKVKEDDFGSLVAFSGVSEFPARVKCASLAWHTLRAALEGQEKPVSTEQESSRGEVSSPLKEKIIDMLTTCFDPEIPVNIYEMGLIYNIDISDQNVVNIKMTLTSPMCPVAGSLPPEVQEKVKRIPGVSDAKVEVVWDPTWKPEMMSEAAKLQLGM